MFEKEIEILKNLNKYKIEIGVISENDGRDDKISIGLTNAQLMQIHENGSPTKNIPARPILDITIKWAEKILMPKTLDKIIDGVFNYNWTISDVEKTLEIMCNRMQNYAFETIYDNTGVLQANSKKTSEIKAEKARRLGNSPTGNPPGNHPLFDTGQLAKSITCRLVKNN